MAAFTWGDAGAQMTPERIAAERKVAQALMAQGMDASPVKHWTQGTARVLQGMMGGYDYRRSSEAEKVNMDRDRADINEMTGRVPALTTIAPPTAVPSGAMPPIVPQSAPMSSAPGKVYANDEPSPLDPPSGRDRDLAIRTMNAEAGNEPSVGQQAVANVIRNRAVNGGYGGDTPSGVVTAPNQFEPWNTAAGRQRMAALDPNSPQYQQLGAALDKAYTGDDPTNGAVNFYGPKSQAALGRPAPKWDDGTGQDIGGHRFFGGKSMPEAAPTALAFSGQPNTATDAPMPGGAPSPALAAVTSGAAPTVAPDPAMLQAAGDKPQQVAQAAMPAAAPAAPQGGPLSSVNPKALQVLSSPYASEGAKKIAGMIVAQQMKEGGTTDELKEYTFHSKQEQAAGRQPQSFTDWKVGLKKAGAIQNNVQIDQKGESEFSKESGKLQAKRFNDLAEDAPAAQQMLSDVGVLRELGAKIGTGKGAEVKAALGPLAESFGVKIDGLDEIQGFQAIINRVAPNLRVKGSGAQSDFELKNFLKSLPSIGNREGGNELASQVLEGLYQNKLAAAEIGAKALNGEMTRTQAEKALRDLPDPMKGWREFNKQQPAKAATSDGWKDLGGGVRIREKK